MEMKPTARAVGGGLAHDDRTGRHVDHVAVHHVLLRQRETETVRGHLIDGDRDRSAICILAALHALDHGGHRANGAGLRDRLEPEVVVIELEFRGTGPVSRDGGRLRGGSAEGTPARRSAHRHRSARACGW